MKGSEFRARRQSIWDAERAESEAARMAGEACREPVRAWLKQAIAAASQPNYSGPSIAELEAEAARRTKPCDQQEQSAQQAARAKASSRRAVLDTEAFDSGGMSGDYFIYDSELKAMADELHKRRVEAAAGAAWGAFIREPVEVKSLAELNTLFAADHHAVSVWLALKMVTGAIQLGGETRTLTELASTTGQYLFRIEEILWLTGTVTGAEPTDVDAVASSELLLPNAVVRTDWRTGTAPATTNTSEECKSPGAWAGWANSFTLAPLMGWLAHDQIGKAYIQQLGLTPQVNVYLDNPFAGPIDKAFIEFLKRKNPRMWLGSRVLLELQAFARPDLLTHRPGLREFEEIKSDSAIGQAQGRLKVRALKWWYNICGLPYTPGTTYVPQKLHLFDDKVLDLDWIVRLEVIRREPGLITYRYCITTDWKEFSRRLMTEYIKYILFLLALLAILYSRGKLKLPPGFKPPAGFPLPDWVPLPT
jgi:hypothetical protein